MDEAGGSIRWIFPRCEIKLGTHKTTSSKKSNGRTSQDCDKMSTFSLPKEGLGLNEQYEQQAWQNPSPPCFGSIRFWNLATPMRIPCKTRWFARSLQLSSASRPSIACDPSGNGTRKWGNGRGKLQRNRGRYQGRFCTSFDHFQLGGTAEYPTSTGKNLLRPLTSENGHLCADAALAKAAGHVFTAYV